jgi:hypothetical protein
MQTIEKVILVIICIYPAKNKEQWIPTKPKANSIELATAV